MVCGVLCVYVGTVVVGAVAGILINKIRSERLAQLLVVLLEHMMVLLLVSADDPLVEEQGLLTHHNEVAKNILEISDAIH